MLSERSTATIRSRIEAIRGSQEQAVLTPELRDAIIAWLDATAIAIESWPLDPFDFCSIAGQLAAGYRARAALIPATGRWRAPKICITCASAWSITAIRWSWSSRYGRATPACGPRKPSGCATGSDAVRTWKFSSSHRTAPAAGALALAAGAGMRRAQHRAFAARRAHRARLFAEKPKAFRHRLEALWEHGRATAGR